jgi:uncharacterized SAM-binding protein YcdF (DUF218 family)
MNEFLHVLGLEAWKPLLTALVMPPVPLLVLVVIGARVLRKRLWLGWTVTWIAVIALWATACTGVGEWLMHVMLKPPPALTPSQVFELRNRVSPRSPSLAVVVVGGGRESRAPEYGTANLGVWSFERLRYGIWLSREIGAPLAYSGGIGWAQSDDGPSEAQIAARIAERDFGRAIRWTEDESRDTRQNAQHSVALLKRDGVREIVLVTHGWHMRRAQRAFEQAAAQSITITPAPMGLAPRIERPILRWVPTIEGFVHVRRVLQEGLGLLVGA